MDWFIIVRFLILFISIPVAGCIIGIFLSVIVEIRDDMVIRKLYDLDITSDEILAIQQKLNKVIGLPTKVTGKMDIYTVDAISLFNIRLKSNAGRNDYITQELADSIFGKYRKNFNI